VDHVRAFDHRTRLVPLEVTDEMPTDGESGLLEPGGLARELVRAALAEIAGTQARELGGFLAGAVLRDRQERDLGRIPARASCGAGDPAAHEVEVVFQRRQHGLPGSDAQGTPRPARSHRLGSACS
jgi:hypothetical protein